MSKILWETIVRLAHALHGQQGNMGIGLAQLTCLLTISRECRMLAAIDTFSPSGRDCPSLWVMKEERSVDGATSFPAYWRKIPLMYADHLVTVNAWPLRFCGGSAGTSLVANCHLMSNMLIIFNGRTFRHEGLCQLLTSFVSSWQNPLGMYI